MRKKILDVWVVDEKEFARITKEKEKEIIKEGGWWTDNGKILIHKNIKEEEKIYYIIHEITEYLLQKEIGRDMAHTIAQRVEDYLKTLTSEEGMTKEQEELFYDLLKQSRETRDLLLSELAKRNYSFEDVKNKTLSKKEASKILSATLSRLTDLKSRLRQEKSIVKSLSLKLAWDMYKHLNRDFRKAEIDWDWIFNTARRINEFLNNK